MVAGTLAVTGNTSVLDNVAPLGGENVEMIQCCCLTADDLSWNIASNSLFSHPWHSAAHTHSPGSLHEL